MGEAEQALIREIVGTCGGLSRMELAATVGELLGWKRRRGSLKARECREFLEKLEKLESQGGLVLPPKRRGRPRGKATEVPVTAGVISNFILTPRFRIGACGKRLVIKLGQECLVGFEERIEDYSSQGEEAGWDRDGGGHHERGV